MASAEVNKNITITKKEYPVNKLIFFIILISSIIGCKEDETDDPINNDIPVIKSESVYTVLVDTDITYAHGLSHDEDSTSPFSIPLKLDVYYPDNNSTNRPVVMFIHGGGFTGGIKHKPEIIEMANYYASRGWVFFSIDYRTTEDLCNTESSPSCASKLKEMIDNDESNGTDELVTFYKGIAPKEWINHTTKFTTAPDRVQQSIAMYAAQRDAKAALRWIVANSSTYNINLDYITVGGNSAGAITTIALGISNQEDFRDEITTIEDSTLSTTNLNQTYDVRSMIYFWGSNRKLNVFEGVYELEPYDRYDSDDPELFMAHGTAPDPVTPYTGALDLQDIYNDLGVYAELKTIMVLNETL